MAVFIPTPTVVYPDSDGQPMSDNTLQFRWIVTIQGNLDALFADDPDVFVAGDLLWYPVEGDNQTRVAPDALVAFGRPKGYRGSYRQWEEGNIAPQVVFEVLSPGNRFSEMQRKLDFYDRFGVEEYYQYDPQRGDLTGWTRREGRLLLVDRMDGFVSPRLGIRFELPEGEEELRIYHPDGTLFLSFVEVMAQREAERTARTAAERERDDAERERHNAERERDEARARATMLAARLRELGIDPDA